MNHRAETRIKKYSRLFWTAYKTIFMPEDFVSLQAYSLWLKKESKIFPALRPEVKQALEQLAMAVVRQGDRALFPALVARITRHFYPALGYCHAQVATSHRLTEREQEEVREHFGQLTHKKVYATFVVDPELISGMRITSDNFLWESSLAQKIALLQKI